VSALYKRTAAHQAVAEAAKAVARRLKLPKDATAKLVATVESGASPIVEKWKLTPAEARDLTSTYLNHLADHAAGRFGTEQAEKWREAALADHRARLKSNDAVDARIDATDTWLKKDHPETHALLQNHIGTHPRFARFFTDRFADHQAEQARRERAAQPMREAPAAASAPAADQPAGGAKP
jgi:hypothetical protein